MIKTNDTNERFIQGKGRHKARHLSRRFNSGTLEAEKVL
jgi:hypothetical protein